MVSTLMLGVPWQDCMSQDHVLIFLCAWHVFKAWRLYSMEKIKDSNVRRVILDRLHMVMFMSINLDETIDDFKALGRKMVVESFDNLQPGVAWTRYFWAYYCHLGK
jgi:hypothetical protein